LYSEAKGSGKGWTTIADRCVDLCRFVRPDFHVLIAIEGCDGQFLVMYRRFLGPSTSRSTDRQGPDSVPPVVSVLGSMGSSLSSFFYATKARGKTWPYAVTGCFSLGLESFERCQYMGVLEIGAWGLSVDGFRRLG
jgi:hypothetical protein